MPVPNDDADHTQPGPSTHAHAPNETHVDPLIVRPTVYYGEGTFDPPSSDDEQESLLGSGPDKDVPGSPGMAEMGGNSPGRRGSSAERHHVSTLCRMLRPCRTDGDDPSTSPLHCVSSLSHSSCSLGLLLQWALSVRSLTRARRTVASLELGKLLWTIFSMGRFRRRGIILTGFPKVRSPFPVFPPAETHSLV